MKITGYKLQHALRELAHLRDVLSSQFKESLWVFEKDDKPKPIQVMDSFSQTEEKIAKLQVAQAKYNLAITVKVGKDPMTLAEAVKRVGGAGRMEKMWRSVAADTGKDRYAMRENARDKNTEYAHRAMPVEKALGMAKEAARFASGLREAIQVGNAQEMEIEGLDPALFE
jgi:hypothetical protein